VTGSGLGTLVITLQGRHQIKYPLNEGEITIGRSKQNDIQINSEFVSRVHARIITDDTGAVIEDVSSKNGVLLDSDPVTRHSFRDGDVVVLGTTLISFQAYTDGAS
jgi:pSer/pThr/pTyr-binding forkhead associated (FHA) protein